MGSACFDHQHLPPIAPAPAGAAAPADGPALGCTLPVCNGARYCDDTIMGTPGEGSSGTCRQVGVNRCG
jgi:hypothetical protein